MSDYNQKLENLIQKYTSNLFSWEDAKTLMAIPSESVKMADWEKFFTHISEYRRNALNKSKQIKIYTPGHHFPALSLTGNACDLSCEHCDTKYLKGMKDASTSEKFLQQLDLIKNQRAIGALLSGGCDVEGQVPVVRFKKEIALFKNKNPDFYFNSHIGILNLETATEIAASGVDMVSFDLIFDKNAIKELFHLDHSAEVYKESYQILHNAEIRIVPHILIGANFGIIKTEIEILQFIHQYPSDMIIFIVMIPPKQNGQIDTRFRLVTPSEVARLIFIASVFMPEMELSLGCMRIRGKNYNLMEKWSILAGINRMEIPSRATLDWLQKNGYDTIFFGACCGIPKSFEKKARAHNIEGKIQK